MAVVVLGEASVMGAKEKATGTSWTIAGVEKLLASLTGVVSVRLVAKPGSDIDEIHMLTTEQVTPKQTVRNVESALMAHFDLAVDHRKISVAQTSNPPAGSKPAATPKSNGAPLKTVVPLPSSPESRILFLGHQTETQRSQKVRMAVALEWQGHRFEGEAAGPDVARGRIEATSQAALRAVEAALQSTDSAGDFTLTLDGVKLIDAFDRDYVIVAVHAISGRKVTHLAGSALVEDTPDKAVIMAVLQATDRWVRGQL